ncbi:MAG: hypothetical protein KIT27_03955 [Legionellales bacterium]|nr:hypothetical protein [Legionellales bacterium]
MTIGKFCRISLICLLFLFSINLSFAGFLGAFGKCTWVMQGDEDPQGYYYLCENDTQWNAASVWATASECSGNAVVNEGTYNLYFCNNGNWQYTKNTYPPCSCIAD